jgi:spore coat polysaccharide biosynthesis predicted glycosyltransferase SpsG
MTNNLESIFFRTEASHDTGYGHLARCLLLAQGFSAQNIKSVFIIDKTNHKFIESVLEKGFETFKIPTKISYEREISLYPEECRYLIVDLFHAEHRERPDMLEKYLSDLKTKTKIKIGFLDGVFSDSFKPSTESFPNMDIWIQPYLGAGQDVTPKAVQWVKGVEYSILGSEYSKLPVKEIKPEIENILITFGGSDPQNLTVGAMKDFLNEGKKYNIRVIVGDYFSETQKKEILEIANQNPDLFNILGFQKNMQDHYNWADIALLSSGMTRYECAAAGLPIIFVSLCPEHHKQSEIFQEMGLGQYLGDYQNLKIGDWSLAVKELAANSQKRHEMSDAAHKAIDGQGLKRLSKRIIALFEES